MKQTQPKSKTLEEILNMVNHLIDAYGTVAVIPMVKVEQNDGRQLYTCALTTGFLQALICRLPRSMENPEGIQRALITKKIKEIAEHLSKGAYSFPNSIVIMLKCRDNPFLAVEPMGPELSGAFQLVVRLEKYRDYLATCETDEAGYLVAPEKELLGFMIDGHHRTEGTHKAEKMDFAFPTSVYADLDKRMIADAFAGINCYQEKPSAIHTTAIRYISGLMDEKQTTAFDIMDQLNSNSSIFEDRIKMFDGTRERNLPRAFVSASKMQILLEKWLTDVFQLGYRYNGLGAQIGAIESYFGAWQSCWPAAWGSPKHVLTKTMGIDILFDLYRPLVEFVRSSIYSGNNTPPTKEDFILILRKCFFDEVAQNGVPEYKEKAIALDEATTEMIPLNWESTYFGALSSGKGIGTLKQHLQNMIGTARYGA